MKNAATGERLNGVFITGDSLNLPSGAQNVNTQNTTSGIDLVILFCLHGISVIGCYLSRAAIASGAEYRAAFTTDIQEVRDLWQGNGDRKGRAYGLKIRLFKWIPAWIKMLVLDVDRNHENGIDGHKNLKAYLESVYTDKPKPAIFSNLPYSFPAWIETPSGGYHLIFAVPFVDTATPPPVKLCAGVDTLYNSGPFIGEKPKGPYVLHGSLDSIPSLPGELKTRLWPNRETPAPRPGNVLPYKGATRWENILKWAEADFPQLWGQGRDGQAAAIACKAKTHGWSETETLTALQSMTWTFDRSFTPGQLAAKVRYTYRGGR